MATVTGHGGSHDIMVDLEAGSFSAESSGHLSLILDRFEGESLRDELVAWFGPGDDYVSKDEAP